MKEMLMQRVNDLKVALEQSAGNHNALIGRMEEAKHCLEQFLINENQMQENKQDHIPE